MKLRTVWTLLLTTGLLGASPLYAQDDDVTIADDEEATAEQTADQLALPEEASETGVEESAEGLDTANRAREEGREFGQSTAEEARERGREARESRRDQSRERGREQARDDAGPDDGGGQESGDIPTLE